MKQRTIKRKDVHLGQADLVQYLLDRQPRSLTEITRAIGDKLPPEQASRFAEKQLSCGRINAISDDHGARVATGRREYLRTVVSSAMADEKIHYMERFNPDTMQTERVYQLIQWFCWSCGVRQVGEVLPEKTCLSCVAVMEPAKANNED